MQNNELEKAKIYDIICHPENEQIVFGKVDVLNPENGEPVTLDIQFVRVEDIMEIKYQSEVIGLAVVKDSIAATKLINNSWNSFCDKNTPIMLRMQFEAIVEFSGGKYHLKYKMDEALAFFAMEVVSKAIQQKLNIVQSGRSKLSANDKRIHAQTVKLTEDIAAKLAVVIYENATTKPKVNQS